MKIKIILFFHLVLFADFIQAQNVNLKGCFFGINDSSVIWFCKSIDDNPLNYCGMFDRAMVHNNSFEKNFYVLNTSLIIVAPNEQTPKISLICGKEDSIKVSVMRHSDNSFDVKFEGSNAEGESFFYQSVLFHTYLLTPVLSTITEAVLRNEYPVITGVYKFDSVVKKLFSTADTLFQHNKISYSFFELIKKQSEANFLFALKSSIQNSLDKINVNDKNDCFDKAQLKAEELQKIYYKRYDPYSSVYNNTDQNLRMGNCQDKCRLIEKGILSGKKNDIGLWSRANEKCYSFAPIELQHRMMAINLSFNGFYVSKSKSKSDSADFEIFKLKFPDSPYLSVLNGYFKKKIKFDEYNF